MKNLNKNFYKKIIIFLILLINNILSKYENKSTTFQFFNDK